MVFFIETWVDEKRWEKIRGETTDELGGRCNMRGERIEKEEQ